MAPCVPVADPRAFKSFPAPERDRREVAPKAGRKEAPHDGDATRSSRHVAANDLAAASAAGSSLRMLAAADGSNSATRDKKYLSRASVLFAVSLHSATTVCNRG